MAATMQRCIIGQCVANKRLGAQPTLRHLDQASHPNQGSENITEKVVKLTGEPSDGGKSCERLCPGPTVAITLRKPQQLWLSGFCCQLSHLSPNPKKPFLLLLFPTICKLSKQRFCLFQLPYISVVPWNFPFYLLYPRDDPLQKTERPLITTLIIKHENVIPSQQLQGQQEDGLPHQCQRFLINKETSRSNDIGHLPKVFWAF